MNKKGQLPILIIALLIIGGAILFFNTGTNEDTNTNTNNNQANNNNNNEEPGEKTFSITGENFKFVLGGIDNPDIRVQEGDTITIEFESTQGYHDWVVDEFDAATEKVRETDGKTTVTFVANKKGTYEYYCSVGSHRENGMKGNLIVE